MTIKQHGGIFGRNPTFNIATASEFVGPVSGLATSAAALKSSATTGLMQITGPAAGATRTMTIPDANFTAARTDAAQSFTGDQTLTDGNLIVASGKGIDFSATAGTGTSELFDDYEEGTWTPVYSPTSGAFGTIGAVTSGHYRKVGDTVFFWAELRTTGTPNLGTASGRLNITGLPFTATSAGAYGQVSIMQSFALGTAFTNLGVIVDASSTQLYLTKNSSNSAIATVQATELSTATSNFGNLLGLFGMYRT